GHDRTRRHADAVVDAHGFERLVQAACRPQPPFDVIVLGRGDAEHRKGRVAFELVDPSPLVFDDVDDHREESVQQGDDILRWPRLGERGRADEVNEQDRGGTQLAAERHAGLQRLTSDLFADVTPEEVLQAAAFPEAGDHGVEAGLEQADLAWILDVNLRIEVAAAHRLEPATDLPE